MYRRSFLSLPPVCGQVYCSASWAFPRNWDFQRPKVVVPWFWNVENSDIDVDTKFVDPSTDRNQRKIKMVITNFFEGWEKISSLRNRWKRPPGARLYCWPLDPDDANDGVVSAHHLVPHVDCYLLIVNTVDSLKEEESSTMTFLFSFVGII